MTGGAVQHRSTDLQQQEQMFPLLRAETHSHPQAMILPAMAIARQEAMIVHVPPALRTAMLTVMEMGLMMGMGLTIVLAMRKKAMMPMMKQMMVKKPPRQMQTRATRNKKINLPSLPPMPAHPMMLFLRITAIKIRIRSLRRLT